MQDLIRSTVLPDEISQYPGSTAGINLATLKSLQAQWTDSFDWDAEQASLNK